jgi:hypothetical protein
MESRWLCGYLEENFGLGEFELLGVVLVEEGFEVGAAAGFVEAGGSDDDEFLRMAEALGVDCGLATDHADSGELGDFVGEGHEDGDRAEGLVGEGGVEAGEDDTLAQVNEFHGEVGDAGVEELGFVEADDVDFVNAVGGEEFVFEAFGRGGNYCCVMGLGAVAGDGGAVVAEVDVGFEAGDALAGDAGSLEAADEFFGFAGEHGAGDDFDAAGSGAIGHALMVPGGVVDFWGVIFLDGGWAFLQRVFGEMVFGGWFFVVSLWFFGGETW